MRDMHETRQIDLNGKRTLLAIADGIVIYGYSQNEVEEKTKKLTKPSKK